jgi:CheY-like chemotaxis protein
MHDFARKPDLPTVLLIDDDLVSREVMATVLTMTGYTVHTAASGEASLELLTLGGCSPAVVLVDAQMPGLSGAKLLEELRTRTDARLVSISASKAPDTVLAAADGFLMKPFGAEALGKLLEGQPAQPATTLPSRKVPPAQVLPVVDPESLAQLREMMPEPAVKQIYVAIVADLYKRLDLLEIAIAHNDPDEVRRIGHTIKGGCGMAGAQEAAHLGALLQSGILENTTGNHLDNSSSVLKNLRTAARNLERMLEAEFPA